MQNQDNTQGSVPNPNTTSGNYNDFYTGTNVNPQESQPFDPASSYNTDMNYDPNSMYNQNQQGFNQDNQGGMYPAPAFDPSTSGLPPVQPIGYNQPAFDPNQSTHTDMNSANTFEEPKSGNRFLVIGVIAIIVILLGVAGVILYNFKDVLFGNNNSTPAQNTTQSTDKNGTSTDSKPADTTNTQILTPQPISISDPNATPAQKSKVYNETAITADWLKKSFAAKPAAVDQITGQCIQATVCGLDADPDGDGFTNIFEFNYQTDPLSADTDGDKLADGDEINVYSTNPKKTDSDGDGFEDNTELTNCYDPNISSKSLPPEDLTKTKLSTTRQNEIKNKIVVNPLHEPTITFLKSTENPTAVTNGFTKCAVTTPASTNTPASTTSEPANVSDLKI